MKSIAEKLKQFKNNPKDVKFQNYAKFVIFTLMTRDNQAQAIEYTKPLGEEILVLISRILKEKQRPTKSSKS